MVVVEVFAVDGGEVVLPGEVVGLGEEDEQVEEGQQGCAEGVAYIGTEREGLPFHSDCCLFFLV